MKRQMDLFFKSPLRTLVAIALVLPILAGIISLLTWTMLPWKSWSFLILTSVCLGACVGFSVWVKNRAVHLSWSAVFGLTLQTFFALICLGSWIAIATGDLKPTPGPFPTIGLLAIAFILLVAAAGVIWDWWWAYFLEAAIILAIGIGTINLDAIPKMFPAGPLPWMKWVNLIMFIGMIIAGLQTALSRGRQLFRARKRPVVQLD